MKLSLFSCGSTELQKIQHNVTGTLCYTKTICILMLCKNHSVFMISYTPLNVYEMTDIIAMNYKRVNKQSTKKVYQATVGKHPKVSCIYIISDNTLF